MNDFLNKRVKIEIAPGFSTLPNNTMIGTVTRMDETGVELDEKYFFIFTHINSIDIIE